MSVPLPPGRFPEPNANSPPYRPGGPPPDEPADAKGKKTSGMAPDQLPQHLQALPVVRLSMNRGWCTAKVGSGDHSNTQFALLALWAARRHDVPCEYSLLLSYQRFKHLP